MTVICLKIDAAKLVEKNRFCKSCEANVNPANTKILA